MAEVSLELKEIKKSFTEGEAVLDNISLEISKGEFITLLGSSGCGKTTTLRIIAGLEQPDAGSVWLDGREVTGLEPNQRDVNTVFQNYALFPHMNVAENIGYGLKLKKVPKSEIKKKVSQMLELVQLEGYEKRKPSELSGGQKQRVAIARALVNNPKVLLLDEPLGALDLQLRRAMQIELKHLQKKLGITFIYITHDQEEAINMSDRIAVMRDGRIEQIGTPDEIYNHPKTSYVATFVGNANILHGVAESIQGENAIVKIGNDRVIVKLETSQQNTEDTGAKQAKEQNLSLNPTKISGVCGRLMCCLKNEQDTYEYLNSRLPNVGDYVTTDDGLKGEVSSVNVLRQLVKVLVEVNDEKEIREYHADQLKFKPKRRRDVKLTAQELKELSALEDRGGKSKFDEGK